VDKVDVYVIPLPVALMGTSEVSVSDRPKRADGKEDEEKKADESDPTDSEDKVGEIEFTYSQRTARGGRGNFSGYTYLCIKSYGACEGSKCPDYQLNAYKATMAGDELKLSKCKWANATHKIAFERAVRESNYGDVPAVAWLLPLPGLVAVIPCVYKATDNEDTPSEYVCLKQEAYNPVVFSVYDITSSNKASMLHALAATDNDAQTDDKLNAEIVHALKMAGLVVGAESAGGFAGYIRVVMDGKARGYTVGFNSISPNNLSAASAQQLMNTFDVSRTRAKEPEGLMAVLFRAYNDAEEKNMALKQAVRIKELHSSRYLVQIRLLESELSSARTKLRERGM
jgi:hypothetical protein